MKKMGTFGARHSAFTAELALTMEITLQMWTPKPSRRQDHNIPVSLSLLSSSDKQVKSAKYVTKASTTSDTDQGEVFLLALIDFRSGL